MTDPGRRFDPSELRDADGIPMPDAESAALLSTARELEAFASESITPTAGFEDRVMAAVAAEAPPRPVATGGWLAGFALVLRDAWRITWGGDGRPLAVRVQAIALVLLAAVALGSVGTLAAVGVSRLFANDPTTPPTTEPSVDPSVAPPTPSLLAPSTDPSGLPSPSTSPSPSAKSTDDPAGSSEPTETPDGTADSGGTPDPSASPRPTSDPTDTPEPTDDDTPEPTDDDGDKTPKPTDTPEPTDTAEPTDDSSGPGSGGDDD